MLRKDKKIDKRIEYKGKIESSNIIDINQVNIKEVEAWSEKNYPTFTNDLLHYLENLNKNNHGYFKNEIVPVKHFNGKEDYTELVGGEKKRIYTVEIGNPNAEQKMVVECVKHGGERIHRVTGYMFLKSLLEQPTEKKEEILDKVRISVLPVVDPMGAHKGTRGYVNREGNETNNPVIVSMRHNQNFFGWEDANAVEGRNLQEAKGYRLRSLQNHFLNVFGPIDSYASLHETVMFPNLVFKNQGVMFLLHHYFTDEEVQKLSSLKRMFTSKDKISRKIRKVNIFKEGTKFIEEELKYHPTFMKATSIRNRVRDLGLNVYDDKLDKALQMLGQGRMADISLDESLLMLGPFYRKAGIILAPDFYVLNGVTNAMTIETFSKPEADRVKEGLGFLEAKLQVEVKDKRFYN
ncbi:hypothetical protein KAR52_02795 [Candidatus Pacearchaeota archaeon]|nr:hypothetical protein [Candidatus Pacearchaeota archaeon]